MPGILIDDCGEQWADDSPQLLQRLGCNEPDFDLAAYAVRNLGFIHLQPHGAGIRVALRAWMFSAETLIEALYVIVEKAPRRILLALFSGEDWSYEIFTKLGSFAASVEALVAGEPMAAQRLFALENAVDVLELPTYATVRPLMNFWRSSRGRMGPDFYPALRASGLQHRTTLVRQLPRSSRLVFEHFGAGIRTMRPCEAIRLVGREMGDVTDREYGNWVAESFARVATTCQLHVASIRAKIHTSDATTIDASYDRILLPWRRGRDDSLVLGISILRERSLVG